jgi:hypothetical protein
MIKDQLERTPQVGISNGVGTYPYKGYGSQNNKPTPLRVKNKNDEQG